MGIIAVISPTPISSDHTRCWKNTRSPKIIAIWTIPCTNCHKIWLNAAIISWSKTCSRNNWRAIDRKITKVSWGNGRSIPEPWIGGSSLLVGDIKTCSNRKNIFGCGWCRNTVISPLVSVDIITNMRESVELLKCVSYWNKKGVGGKAIDRECYISWTLVSIVST